MSRKLDVFVLNGSQLKVRYIETLQLKDGVECDTYQFVDDDSKDLAIVTVKAGSKTPLQKVLKGKHTVEGFVSGKACLTIGLENGESQVYDFGPNSTNKEVSVAIGQTMQWVADNEAGLVFYEICEPPYEDGRYEDLPE